MDTLQQRMAVTAHRLIHTVGEDDKQKYGTMAHRLPMLIRRSGLAQALAFVEARGQAPQHTLLQHLAETIEYDGISNRAELVAQSRAAHLADYMLLTRRTMAALVWYVRFTESVLKVPKTANAGLDDSAAAAD